MAVPYRRLGANLVPAVLSLLLICLFWGCDDSGNPFNKSIIPVFAISGMTPAPGATGVDVGTNVTIALPLDVDARTVSLDTVHLLRNGQVVVLVNILYDSVRRLITIIPRAPLSPNTQYQVSVQGLNALSGAILSTFVANFFTGAAVQGPRVIAVQPLPNSVLVPQNSPIQITFNKSMDQRSVIDAFSINPTTPGTITFQDTGNTTMTFVPFIPYPPGIQVVTTIRGTAKDNTGLQLPNNFVTAFATQPTPSVLSSSPENNQTFVATNTPITVVFSTTMTTSTVAQAFSLTVGGQVLNQSNGTFTFSTITTGVINGTTVTFPPRTVATFQPTEALPASSSVGINVNFLALSSTGVGLAPLFFATFFTQ